MGFAQHGFVESNGVFNTIDVAGAFAINPYGVNDAGQIVGEYSNSHGFLFIGGTFTTLDFPGSVSSAATGINDSGQIVGWYNGPTGRHAYLLSGSIVSTIDFPGAFGTAATGINNAGQIVGGYSDSTGFSWFRGHANARTGFGSASCLGTRRHRDHAKTLHIRATCDSPISHKPAPVIGHLISKSLIQNNESL
jgi:uncharacterized membrane protein